MRRGKSACGKVRCHKRHCDKEIVVREIVDRSISNCRMQSPIPADTVLCKSPSVFTTFWPLGFFAFGGPQAHIAILRNHLVTRRDWVTEEQFLELFAIGQVCADGCAMNPSVRSHNCVCVIRTVLNCSCCLAF